MHPDIGHTLGDGVVCVAHVNLEIHARGMPGIEPLPLRNKDDLVVIADSDSAPERTPPPSEANHVVVDLPRKKGVVGRMEDDQTTATLNIRLERTPDIGGPQ